MKNKFIRREKLNKVFSLKLALIILLQVCWPTASMALTGGPSQPEVQGFEPIGTSDMVDPFSGDFTYNIPLFDIDGYPINISYHSGVGMDQEASWVGLGWNVNPGVINRNLRGIPDDFNGDQIVKEQNMKKNQTLGVSCGVSGELFGFDNASFNARLGVKYNNYTGIGMERSFNVAMSASNKFGQSASVSLGITSSSDDGLSLQPSISLGQSVGNNQRNAKLGVSLGASFNSRAGLSALTLSRDVSFNMIATDKNKKEKKMNYGMGLGSSSFNLMQPTYSPSLDFPMGNLSITASLKFGGEAYGWAYSFSPSAYYAEQGQLTKVISSPAYGYMNAHIGQANDKAMMDYNREKDGAFTPSTFNLPITNLTYDIYSVSGQGTGGSYRPFRSDVGHVFDISSYSTSDGYSASVELGGGGVAKVGTDIMVNSAYSNSGNWSTSKIAENISFQGSGKDPDYEACYFKEANERSVNTDPGFLTRYGGFEAVRPELDGSTLFDAQATGKLKKATGATIGAAATNNRIARDRRNQTITTLTNFEVSQGMGLFGSAGSPNPYVVNNLSKIGHHIGQISSLNTDGKRYIYGIPAYNKQQQELTFAVGKPVGGGSARSVDSQSLVTYQASDITTGNKMGLDNYYSNTKMPAYAHSYLLSAVLSSDYVDRTGDGPTDDDLGNYTLFNYEEVSDFNWRTPVGKKKAKFSLGLMADENDDKGSIVYGTKQLFYLKKIITKNHEAEFDLDDREDGAGVNDIDGEMSSITQKYIKKITLRTKKTLKTIKTVHFDYDYSLCPGITNSTTGSGKLTLKKLFFTYQDSDKGAYNAYNFTYGTNANYSIKDYDRWGNYKNTPIISDQSCTTDVPDNEFFPYTIQDKPIVDQAAKAWQLSKIELPSGGEIEVGYESDDYAYVQDKQATQMYFFNDGNCPGSNPQIVSAPNNTTAPNDANQSGWVFKFKLPAGIPPGTKIDEFFPDDGMVYFKFKMRINPITNKYDYVPGYAQIDPNPIKTFTTSAGYAQIAFMPVKLDDKPNSQEVSPFVRAGIQFGRLNTPRIIWNQPNASASVSEQAIKALANSSFFQNIGQTIQGPNLYLFSQNRGTQADLSNCCIKLKNVNGFKYGGGSRVAGITLNDKFNAMTSNGLEQDTKYGQTYDYTKVENGKVISSGVAAYEPQIGGEENALKKPFFTETKHLLAPDDDHYVEAPFGECFYPAASVGYSRVKVSNYNDLQGPGTLEKHGTGYIVNEFYTARDFPTISERTELEAIQHKSDPFQLSTLFSVESKDHMTTSQGFYVELNDMHGKQKAVRVFNNFDKEISSTEYFYKSTNYGNGSKRLTNNCTVISPSGGVSTAEIGVFFDAVGDFREQYTQAESNSVNINVDMFWTAIFVVVVVPIPSFSSDETQFRSATVTKVVQRFGLLDKTVVKKDGSTVTQKDLAYDAETGEVLLTQTANDFNDPVYNFRYPAYWYYGNMGAAYKNIGYTTQLTVVNGQAAITGKNYFRDGDELELIDGNNVFSKAWVTKSVLNKVELRNEVGNNTLPDTYTVKVIRSGARNMQTMDMANIQTLVNPIGGINSNVYQKVVSAKAIEFENRWNTNCECIVPEDNKNPYTNGTAGNYRAIRNYEYLTSRGQTNTQNNSNIRVDGMFNTYSPFYKKYGGKWVLNPDGWTFASEVTEFNPYGQELENRDGLGRYSAATFGFNQSLATAVGANTRYRELGYQSFEDNAWTNCSDVHFNFTPISSNDGITSSTSHTGRYSFKVDYNGQSANQTKPYIMKQLGKECDKVGDCKLEIVYNSNISAYDVENGEAPYIIDVEKITGSGGVNVQNNGSSFTITNNGGYKCKVTVIDAKGCVFTKLIISPYTN